MTRVRQIPRLWFQSWPSRVLAKSTTLYSPLRAGCPRELLKPGADNATGYREGACYLGRFGWKEASLNRNPEFKV